MTQKTIVAFHIGRGGRFKNAGHLTFFGCQTIGDVMDRRADSRWTSFKDRDEKGRFCKPHYVDHNGNEIITQDEVSSGVGRIEWDGQYDTDYTKYAEDCNDSERDLIFDEAQRHSGQYASNYPLSEIIEDVSDDIIQRAAEKGVLEELYWMSMKSGGIEEFTAEYLTEETEEDEV